MSSHPRGDLPPARKEARPAPRFRAIRESDARGKRLSTIRSDSRQEAACERRPDEGAIGTGMPFVHFGVSPAKHALHRISVRIGPRPTTASRGRRQMDRRELLRTMSALAMAGVLG